MAKVLVLYQSSYGHMEQMAKAAAEGAQVTATITGNKGQRQPSEKDLAGARYQGQRVAEIAAKLAA
jgi:NAD(P)H dehydrogenase (quinone)